MDPLRVWIVCPCFFDTASFLRVREEALATLGPALPGARVQFALVDDTAGQDPGVADLARLDDVQVVAPPYNLGHQGALVYALRGLRAVIDEHDLVVTMDSDGEDRPGDLATLVAPLVQARTNERLVALAIRTKRHESVAFKLFYWGFKALFRTLTGIVIRNGNFVAFRGWLLQEVIHHPHFDQCYSSSFISLPMQIAAVPLPRGTRYGGRSRMGYMGLFTHGVRMLMPFSEKIATRGIVGSAALVGASLAALAFCVATGRAVALPLFAVLYGTLTLGISFVLFATFSQSKSRSLRGLTQLVRPAEPPSSAARRSRQA